MQCESIQENDVKQLKQVLNIIKRAEFPKGVAMVESIAIADALKWFDAFTQAIGKSYSLQNKAPKQSTTEGIDGVKIKEINPGDFSPPVPLARKAKVTSKRKK